MGWVGHSPAHDCRGRSAPRAAPSGPGPGRLVAVRARLQQLLHRRRTCVRTTHAAHHLLPTSSRAACACLDFAPSSPAISCGGLRSGVTAPDSESASTPRSGRRGRGVPGAWRPARPPTSRPAALHARAASCITWKPRRSTWPAPRPVSPGRRTANATFRVGPDLARSVQLTTSQASFASADGLTPGSLSSGTG